MTKNIAPNKLFINFIHLCACLLFLAFSSMANASQQPQQTYEIGISPYLSLPPKQKPFLTVINNMANRLNHRIAFEANETTADFHLHLKRENYDIIMVQPFEYVALQQQYGYIPLAALKQPLKGLIVAKKNSAIQTIQNLLGRKLLLPPESTAISYLVKKHLHNFGFNLKQDISIQYEQTNIACLQKLLLGFTDACATSPDILVFFEQRMEVRFRVISQTIEIPDTLFAAHPRIDAARRQAFTNTLLNQKNDNNSLVPFRQIADRDYNIVRKIKHEVDSY